MSEDHKLADTGDYNLFRYCHNDPVDLTDPMGLRDTVQTHSPQEASKLKAEDRAYNFIMGLMQRQFNSAIGAGMAGYSAWSAWTGLSQMMGGVTTAQGSHGAQVTKSNASAPQINPTIIREGMSGTDESVRKMDETGIPHSVVSYTSPDGHQAFTKPQPGTLAGVFQGHEVYREQAIIPLGAIPRIVGHSHTPGNAAFSTGRHSDIETGARIPVMKNWDAHRGYYDLYYRGWRFYLNPSGSMMGSFPYGN